MTPLIDKLVKYLHDNKELWIPKGELLLKEWRDDKGVRYMADTVSRKLREAEELKRIAVKYEGRKKTFYRWLPYERRDSYIPTGERKTEALFTSP